MVWIFDDQLCVYYSLKYLYKISFVLLTYILKFIFFSKNIFKFILMAHLNFISKGQTNLIYRLGSIRKLDWFPNLKTHWLQPTQCVWAKHYCSLYLNLTPLFLSAEGSPTSLTLSILLYFHDPCTAHVSIPISFDSWRLNFHCCPSFQSWCMFKLNLHVILYALIICAKLLWHMLRILKIISFFFERKNNKYLLKNNNV